MFTGQFLLLFFAFAQGLPPGVASVTQQMHAFFTVLLAALFLRDIPGRRQMAGMTIAFAGLGFIASTVGSEIPLAGLVLGLGGAFSWAVGSVLVKRAPAVPTFPLVVWCSLVPPLPALLLSVAIDRRSNVIEALLNSSWRSLAAVVYLGVLATVVAYALWGRLLQKYPSGIVAPFALLAPCTGVVSSAVLFGEAGSPMRYAGMALILGGLAVAVIPAPPRRPGAPNPSDRRAAASEDRRASSDRR
jgi:O-acetylserine/cysteine efflux transporter